MPTTFGLTTKTHPTLCEALMAAHEDCEICEIRFQLKDEDVILNRHDASSWTISITHKGTTRKF